MTDEEKKAIERIEDVFYQDLGKGINKIQKITLYEDSITDIRTVLNLIEKQSKEIEELKEERKSYTEKYIHNNPWLYKQLNEVYMLRTEAEQKEKKAYIKGTNDAHELCNKMWKDKIKEILHLTDEECNSEEKIFSLLETIWDEFNRLEDIEDRKVQVDYERVFNKGVKSVEDKIKAKIKEISKEWAEGELDGEWYEFMKYHLESLLEKE